MRGCSPKERDKDGREEEQDEKKKVKKEGVDESNRTIEPWKRRLRVFGVWGGGGVWVQRTSWESLSVLLFDVPALKWSTLETKGST